MRSGGSLSRGPNNGTELRSKSRSTTSLAGAEADGFAAIAPFVSFLLLLRCAMTQCQASLIATMFLQRAQGELKIDC